MSNLTPFIYGTQPVRVVTIDGEPWFVLADLCKVLGISNPRSPGRIVVTSGTNPVDHAHETCSSHVYPVRSHGPPKGLAGDRYKGTDSKRSEANRLVRAGFTLGSCSSGRRESNPRIKLGKLALYH